MSFRIDKQTLNDLEIFPSRRKDPALFEYYDKTVTSGGQEKLYKIFSTPILDIDFINSRVTEIEFFVGNSNHLSLVKRQVDFIEHYLQNRKIPLKGNLIDAAKDKIANKLKSDGDYYIITQGIFNVILLLVDINEFLIKNNDLEIPESLHCHFTDLNSFLDNKIIKDVLVDPPERAIDIKAVRLNKLDYFLRVSSKETFVEVLTIVYELDVLQSLSTLIVNQGFTLPEFVSDNGPLIEANNCFHPFLEEAVTNSFSSGSDNSFCFLTGPNMSGKSTLLKTISTLVYLSHLGLPIPASKLRISLFNGLFTTLNLPDNLNQGLSHFYSEVKRVKEMSLEIKTHRNLVVVLDELFRGTNVKDAYDATLLVISSLSKIRGCLFFVSSHILEVAEELSESNLIDFRCFESALVNNQPVYDYKLKSGLSKERIGLQIVKNEEIESILKDIIEEQENDI